eukprot:264836-Pleurochrysis_carterae.AAC.1
MGASGSNEPIAVAIERISGVPLKPSMLRAINLLDALVLRSASTATAAGATIDVSAHDGGHRCACACED